MSGEDHDEGLLLDRPTGGVRPGELPFPLFCHPRFDPVQAFVAHHTALRAAVAAHPYAGFLAAVADGDRLATTWLAASDERVRAAIIGRHSRATLALPRDQATAALRHLALIVRSQAGRPLARLLDLQTEVGFADPLGRRFEAVRTDGPTFISVGGAILMLFPTGPGVELLADPERAWAAFPPRRWIEARRNRAQTAAAGDLGETTIFAEDGPRGFRGNLCGPEEIPLGLLAVSAEGQQNHVRVSGRALGEGFLIGRYDRCDVGGPDADESLSRVHLLVVREGSRVLAIDTASTNGTYIGEERVHLVELDEKTRLDLGGVLELTWRICN